MTKPTLASLYSGSGGSAFGFQNAGFEITFMNDKDEDACKTLTKNFKRIIKPKDIKNISDFGNPNVIEGGFPCQGFSVGRYAKPPKKKENKKYTKIENGKFLTNDTNNSLYLYLKRAIDKSNPDFFVAENVKGFVHMGEKTKKGPHFKNGKISHLGDVAQAIIDDLKLDDRYVVKRELHNAFHFGLPQERERIIIVGIRKDIADKFEFKFPEPTHDENNFVSMKKYGVPNFDKKSDKIFRETKENHDDYFGSRYMSRNRVRKWSELSHTIPAQANAVPAQPDCKMWDTKDGERPMKLDKDPKSETYDELVPYDDADWSEKRKEYEGKISKTLTRLSVKQCAKIQGLPEKWEFAGELLSRYRQIGNAVPPPMMQKVAECIMAYYKGKKSSY